jgi:molybdate transport system substrate-binding protein
MTPSSLSTIAALVFTLGLTPMTTAQSAELRILAGGGIAGPLNELTPQFERASGHKLVIVYDATPGLIKRTQSEPFDLAVAPREVYADAAAKACFAPGPDVVIARAGFGVAVRAGAAKPEIGTAEKMKAALLKAKSVAVLPASAAGAQVTRMFERLGIAEEMKGKSKVQTGPAAIPQAVANGDAELGLFLINVLMAPGVDIAGPFPPELQQELVYLAAVSAGTKAPAAATAFIDFLGTPAAAGVIKGKGMTPG